MKYALRICGMDFTLHRDKSDCPNNDAHEPTPRGYAERHKWTRRLRSLGDLGSARARVMGVGR